MCSGFNKHIQIARCFRDEDLRSDRKPEFTQIDIEMSFVDSDDVFSVQEGFIKRLFKEIKGIDINTPIRRMTYDEAITRFGSDKPDLRFGFEIRDIRHLVKGTPYVPSWSFRPSRGSPRAW